MFWSMSVSDLRRSLLVDEGRDIGACHLRGDLLGDERLHIVGGHLGVDRSLDLCLLLLRDRAVGNTGRICLRGQAHGRKDLRRDLLTGPAVTCPVTFCCTAAVTAARMVASCALTAAVTLARAV